MINTKGTISLLVGQCGIQVGDAIFDELASSYMLQNNGKNVTYNNFNDQHDVNNNVNAFFDEKYHARAILVDTEAKVVAKTIAKSKHRKWKYSNNNKKDIDSISVVRQGGAANNWAYGYMDQSNIEVATQTIEKVRKQIEKLDYLYGFNIIYLQNYYFLNLIALYSRSIHSIIYNTYYKKDNECDDDCITD